MNIDDPSNTPMKRYDFIIDCDNGPERQMVIFADTFEEA